LRPIKIHYFYFEMLGRERFEKNIESLTENKTLAYLLIVFQFKKIINKW